MQGILQTLVVVGILGTTAAVNAAAFRSYGTVLEVQHVTLSGRHYAAKLVHGGAEADPRTVERTIREAQLAAARSTSVPDTRKARVARRVARVIPDMRSSLDPSLSSTAATRTDRRSPWLSSATDSRPQPLNRTTATMARADKRRMGRMDGKPVRDESMLPM